MRYTEGRAWLSKCENPKCEMPIIEAHVDGLKLRLDTKAIPFKDADIFQKYERIVINIWKTPQQFMAVAWFRDLGRPIKGHLFIQHVHNRIM